MTTHPETISANENVRGQRGDSLASLFARVCGRFGDRIAVSCGNDSIRYDELDGASNRVAGALKAEGAGAGTIVAICLPRSIEMIVAMLGVVKAGAAYLPLDPAYPMQRIEETIADAAPIAVIAGEGFEGKCLRLNELLRRGVQLKDVAVDPDAPAYVIYTSGSTGRPKGVVVSHRNLVRLLRETQRWFQFDERDVWTMFHSFAFDFSVWEIWGALLHGGRLVIVPFAVSRSPEEFYALVRDERVTVLNQTPSAFVLFNEVDARMQANLALRVVVFGGEALSLGSLRGWMGRHGDDAPQLVNMYGITETTVHVTYRRVFAADVDERESLIGEPIADMQVYLLDEQLRPVSDGDEGEICVGGGGVALGYLNRPELTAERFVADPFAAGGRLYRSGDLARRRADGELVYLGRRDFQVKINGFRIELGEVEAAMALVDRVKQACVITDGGRLMAFYSTVDALPIEKSEVSRALAVKMPKHMLPSIYQHVAQFPLNANGKVDRGALALPASGATRSAVRGSSMEAAVSAVWASVLGSDDFGLDENFFDVGGSSLLLIAVRSQLQEKLAREIAVVSMFECTTVKTLAARLQEPDQATTAAQDADKVFDNARRQRDAFARARAARSGVRV